MKTLQLGAFLMAFAVSGQALAFGGYNPIAGRPWSSGNTSMHAGDWSQWSVGPAFVANRAGFFQTWTVPLDSYWQTNQGQGAGSIGVSMLSGTAVGGAAAATTAQTVVNDIYGARITYTGVVSSTSTTVWHTFQLDAGFVDTHNGHVVYINYVVAPNGGAIGSLSPLKLLN